MSEDRVIYIPDLSATGSHLRGSALFVKGAVSRIRANARTRRFGPNKDDFDDLANLVCVLADTLEEHGNTLYLYNRYLKEQGIDLRHKTIPKFPHED